MSGYLGINRTQKTAWRAFGGCVLTPRAQAIRSDWGLARPPATNSLRNTRQWLYNPCESAAWRHNLRNPSSMFQERKAAQIAAFYIRRSPGKRLSGRQIQTLTAVAECEALLRFGLPMMWDTFFIGSNYGLALEQVGKLLNGNRQSSSIGWSAWIGTDAAGSGKTDFILDAMFYNKCESASLDEISPVEIDVLDSVWNKRGAVILFAPMINRLPLPFGPASYATIAKVMGYSDIASAEIEAQVKAEMDIGRLFERR